MHPLATSPEFRILSQQAIHNHFQRYRGEVPQSEEQSDMSVYRVGNLDAATKQPQRSGVVCPPAHTGRPTSQTTRSHCYQHTLSSHRSLRGYSDSTKGRFSAASVLDLLHSLLLHCFLSPHPIFPSFPSDFYRSLLSSAKGVEGHKETHQADEATHGRRHKVASPLFRHCKQ